MAARTSTTIRCGDCRLKAAVCVLVLSSCVSFVWSHSRSLQTDHQEVIEVSYFPSSWNNFGFRGQLSEPGIKREQLGVLQLKNENGLSPNFTDYMSQSRNILQFRKKRDVVEKTVSKQVTESQKGVLMDFRNDFQNEIPASEMANRGFALISTSAHQEMFEITGSGQLKLRNEFTLDYEDPTMRTTTFVVHATSNSDPSDVYKITATLTVTDVDEAPVFQTRPQPYWATVRSDSGSGLTILVLVATDPEGATVRYDKGAVSPINYGNQIELLTVTNNGVRECHLRTAGSGRFTEGDVITIPVKAKDRDENGLETTVDVNVEVGVRSPQFYETAFQGAMPENNQLDQTVYKRGTTSELTIEWKTFQNGPVTLSLSSTVASDSAAFDIRLDGDNRAYIVCRTEFDYERENPKTKTVTVNAVQRVGTKDLPSSVTLTVEILDINDNAPVFERSQYQATIREDVSVGSFVLNVVATDADTGPNAAIQYSLLDTEDFEIDTLPPSGSQLNYVGSIKTKRYLDYDAPQGRRYHSFKVKATDGGSSDLTSTSNIRVAITNINDETPQFSPLQDVYSVSESADVNTLIATVQATDGDGDSVTYSFGNRQQSDQKFRIDANSGEVTLAQRISAFDVEFTLTILARDDGSCCTEGPNTPRENRTSIYVQVSRPNKERPDFRTCSTYSPSVNEHSVSGSPVITVEAEDSDLGPNGQVTYTLTQSQDVFNIDSSSGVITVKADIDREVTPFKQVTVKAIDGGTPAEETYCSFRVTINDVNDNAPRFGKSRYVGNITVGVPVNVPFIFLEATDDDVGNNAKIVYSLPVDQSGKFSIIPENGYISLALELETGDIGKLFNLTAMAKDEGDPQRSATVEVQVKIETGDTNPPYWDQDYNQLSYQVEETVGDDYVIIRDMSCDSNIANKRVEFQLVGQETALFKLVDVRQSQVSVAATGRFDYEAEQEHRVKIRCLSFGSIGLVNETNPQVRLININNKPPQFNGLDKNGRYAASVFEEKPPGTIVGTVEATDPDYPNSNYNRVTFTIIEGADNFSIEAGSKLNTAVVRTLSVFDREKSDVQYLRIQAEDGAPSSNANVPQGPRNTESVYMNVQITDINDNAPYFQYDLYQISVHESTYINDLIEPAIKVDDLDEIDNGRHTYRIVSGNTNNAFGIRNGLGNLFPLRTLDYEGSDKHFLLVIEASDGRNSTQTTVNVTVIDDNDNSPTFDPSSYTVEDIVENDYNIPRVLLTVQATDADIGRTDHIFYSLESSSFPVGNFFRIGQTSGQLEVIAALDRDPPLGRPNYQFMVIAADERVEPNFGYAAISVNPRDVNDNAPQFVTDPMEASVPESSNINTFVVRLEATDNDYGNNATLDFTILNIVEAGQGGAADGPARPGYFKIDGGTGVVKTDTEPANLDRETRDKYYLTVRVSDRGIPEQKSTTGTLIVTLSDINDQPPICKKGIYRVDMTENLKSGEVVRVVAEDKDEGDNARITYVLDGPEGSRFFSVTDINNEGSVQIGTPGVDYEKPAERLFNLTVKAQGTKGVFEDTCYVEIHVLDFNDNIPDIEPKTAKGNVSEAALPGTLIATFSATDADATQINNEFDFSISRASDPRRHFSIGADSGQVKVRRRLDRETQAVHELTIQAIDKGNPALTGTATLTVVVDDENDNYPTFKEPYNPHIMENVEVSGRTVQVVLGKDPDADPFGPPFGFAQGSCPSDCGKFSFAVSESAADGNGSATITVRTTEQFNREYQKQYLFPIVMWDRRGTSLGQTGTNTLTITIADENDNKMYPGTQEIFVYNYKGQFGPIHIGRVYVEDEDDWDLPDKFFNYTSPAWMNNYFTVDYKTGMITMVKGVPASPPGKPFEFEVKVYDQKWDKRVTSTVRVTVEELTEEAVRNSGATRFRGTSEDFIRVPRDTKSGSNDGKSAFTKFHNVLVSKLNTQPENVQIISVQDVEGGGYTDVRYAMHGSPYYPPAQTDSVIVMNRQEFEDQVGFEIEEVPIDACAEEVFEGGCYNDMDITGNPALVNANGTSFVGVEVFIRAREGCRALDFPDPDECSADYCYHGGTCVQNDFGVLACIDCPDGFEGPRCQQLRHGFDGQSYAMYAPLEQCEDSHTSIEFITTKGNGMLLYNGPMSPPGEDQPQDFISLELSGGMPVLNIDHGSGPATLSLDGSAPLADGKWHKIDIIRKGKDVEMIVDDCRAAASSGNENSPPDTRPCRATAMTRGENSFLNVATLLYVGGRHPQHSYPSGNVIQGAGFEGCVRNLNHNSKLYDLHFKEIPGVPSGANGCPAEDELCKKQNCGENSICTATIRPLQATCTCKPGWRGSQCNGRTTVRDLKSDSFLAWKVKGSVELPSYMLQVQVMYRTYDSDGVLFTVSDGSKRVTMELKDGRLQALYNLGGAAQEEDHVLLLSKAQANDGFWHVARFDRVMHRATLTLDHGEGRNQVTRRVPPGGSGSNVYMTLDSSADMYGGASVTTPSGALVLDRDLENTCVQDVRLNGEYLAIKNSENSASADISLVDEANVQDGCSRDNGCAGVPAPVCPVNSACVDVWGRHICKCNGGYHELDSGQCRSDCLPDNPCFLDAPCSVENGTLDCVCTAPWFGTLCNMWPAEKEEESVGLASTAIVAIVMAILLIIILALLAFFLVTYYKRKRARDDFDKFVVEEDADFDIRENVIFYDEEGAGEEDQNAFDLSKLPTGNNEVIKPPTNIMPRHRELPRGRRAGPDDRPDVGDVLHDRLHDADDDLDAPPHDTLIAFDSEGGGSDAGSLSSLGSSSSDASQDYDYLNDWGPKFAKLADMYGSGQPDDHLDLDQPSY